LDLNMLAFKALIFFIVIFISKSLGIVFNCDFYDGSWSLGLSYTCRVNQEKVAGNDSVLLAIEGKHLKGRIDKDVTALIIWNQYSYSEIPAGINKFFPHLDSLQFNAGGLTSVKAKDLEPFPDLKEFSVYDNKLKAVDSDLFIHTPHIEWISFSDNPITIVGYHLLSSLRRLRYADFRDNSCISVLADKPALVEKLITSLRHKCPSKDQPLTTTTTTTETPTTTISIASRASDECPNPTRCTINEEIDDLRKQFSIMAVSFGKYEEEFTDQRRIVNHLKSSFEQHGKRLHSLEEWYREILVRQTNILKLLKEVEETFMKKETNQILKY